MHVDSTFLTAPAAVRKYSAFALNKPWKCLLQDLEPHIWLPKIHRLYFLATSLQILKLPIEKAEAATNADSDAGTDSAKPFQEHVCLCKSSTHWHRENLLITCQNPTDHNAKTQTLISTRSSTPCNTLEATRSTYVFVEAAVKGYIRDFT